MCFFFFAITSGSLLLYITPHLLLFSFFYLPAEQNPYALIMIIARAITVFTKPTTKKTCSNQYLDMDNRVCKIIETEGSGGEYIKNKYSEYKLFAIPGKGGNVKKTKNI